MFVVRTSYWSMAYGSIPCNILKDEGGGNTIWGMVLIIDPVKHHATLRPLQHTYTLKEHVRSEREKNAYDGFMPDIDVLFCVCLSFFTYLTYCGSELL